MPGNKTAYSIYAKSILKSSEGCRARFWSYTSGVWASGVEWGKIWLLYLYNLWLNKCRSICVKSPAGTGLLMWLASQMESLKLRRLWVSVRISTQENRCLACNLRKWKASNGCRENGHDSLGLGEGSRRWSGKIFSFLRQVTISLPN